MIPSIKETSPVQAQYLSFIQALEACGFEGDLNPDYANRTVLATDNSIYQVLPQGVLYPKNAADLVRITELSSLKQFTDIVLSPRGGGTGTNGQSLTDGLIVDTSKYMNKILEINTEECWVRVQSGVVKDQLNAALKPHGLFFAPELSTSNRATIGGMINTDASGQGSCMYGKTRDHVLSLTTVFMDGTEWTSEAMDEESFKAASSQQNRIGELHRVVDSIDKEYRPLIDETFPKLNRCLTGYDLAHIRDDNEHFNLNSVLCGSEGTLGFITEAKLNLLKIPKTSALVIVKYTDFNAALRDATELMKAGPTSIETIDSKVLNLAMNDIVWHSVGEFFPEESVPVQGINLVEYTAESDQELEDLVKKLTDRLDEDKDQNDTRISYSLAWGSGSVAKIWAMRKRAVGLLGNAQGEARPIPFVEDTAVPPENLADFIAEFRALLDSHNLAYGMFGHVDAGVLHVRPTIDMKDPDQEKLIREISDKVCDLTYKYNGLLWGEHGKGVRSEYAPKFFGELYPQLQRIKATCDPNNQLNPGKIATPSSELELLKIDEVTTRGHEDRKIPVQVWEGYKEAVYCNGNGACFNWNPNDAMCPSWKGTRQRIHSPKGRASLVREWLKQLSDRDIDPVELSKQAREQSFVKSFIPKLQNTMNRDRGEYDFSNEVMTSMSGCLACKSCVGQCPIKVDVPTFRSQFLELYYSRYLRPLKDYFIGSLEFTVPTLAKMSWLYNGVMKRGFTQWLLDKFAGMVDSPLLSGIDLRNELDRLELQLATEETLSKLDDSTKAKAVIIIQDAFTSYFDTRVLVDTLRFLKELGFTPLLAPYKPNGKPLHVHGFLKAFEKTAKDSSEHLKILSDSGIPLVGIEPSMTLAYRSEYQKVLGSDAPDVRLLQEWLSEHLEHLKSQSGRFSHNDYRLMAHCTEKTNAAGSIGDWKSLFEVLGLSLTVVDTGCCGMAGTYGHESANVETSKTIYSQSWGPAVQKAHDSVLMATGYSCRSQVKRMDSETLLYPAQALLKALR